MKVLPLLIAGLAVLLAGCESAVPALTGTPNSAAPRVVAVEPVFADQFDRADAAALGNGWIEKNAAAFSIGNGEVTKAAAFDYRANIVYRPASEALQDVQASVSFVDTYDNAYAPGYPQLFVRVQNDTAAAANTLDGYMLYIPNNPNTALIGRQRGTTEVVSLATITLAQPIAYQGRYRLTLSAIGNGPAVTLEAGVEQFDGTAWQSLGTATFDDTSADRITAAGTVGFSGNTEGGRYTYDNFVYGQAIADNNAAPSANFTYAGSGLTVNFTSTSSDTDGSIAAYGWDFGDGVTATTQNPSHTYAAGGTYTVRLTVTDNGGATGSTSRSVTVGTLNQTPTANFTFAVSALTANFTSTSSDADGSIAAYSWTFGDGVTATTQNPSHTYAAGGTYTATLRVTDNAGASASTSRSVTVTAPNQPPTAAFTFGVTSGLTVGFTSTSTDADGSITAYAWTFGNGATSTAQNPSLTFASAGTYNVSLRVTDNAGASATASQNVTVTLPNLPPVAAFTSSASGLTAAFTSTSTDADGSIVGYSWNFGDGVTASAQNPSHTYGSAGTYSVTLRVTDNAGASVSASRTVAVTAPNLPPTANFTSSVSGLTASFVSTSADADGSIVAYLWTFGDGLTSALANPSHVFAAAGTYPINLCVTDNAGATAVMSRTVTVTAPNLPPTVNFSSSVSGLNVSFTSACSDADGSCVSYAWNFGDGVTASVQNPSHSYSAAGSYTVTLRVTDNLGAATTTARTVGVTAANAAPVVNAGADITVLLGLLCTYNVSFSDANANGPWSYIINWGDGTSTSGSVSSQGTISAAHTYLGLLSSRTMTCTVTDGAGASASDSKVISLVL